MRWHRNPFFQSAVLPPSVAPSAGPSARPSADLDTAVQRAAQTAPRISTDSKSGGADNDGPPASPTAGHHGILAEAALRAARDKKQQQHPRFSFMSRRRPPPRHLPRLTILEPSDSLTPYQFFYVFILDGLGAFVLSGAINFAIAYAMYKTINSDLHPIRLFRFPNTLAGDAAVTIFLQNVITWFIELVLVNRDLRTGHIQPIGFLPEPAAPLVRWFVLLDRFPDHVHRASASDSTDDEALPQHHRSHDDACRCQDQPEPYASGSLKHWLFFLVSQLVRALLVGVASFFIMWGPAIGILTAVGAYHDSDWWFNASSWAPPVFKLIYGGVLALITTPFFAAFWLVRCGWALRANERHLEEGLRRGADSTEPETQPRTSMMIPPSILPEAGLEE